MSPCCRCHRRQTHTQNRKTNETVKERKKKQCILRAEILLFSTFDRRMVIRLTNGNHNENTLKPIESLWRLEKAYRDTWHVVLCVSYRVRLKAKLLHLLQSTLCERTIVRHLMRNELTKSDERSTADPGFSHRFVAWLQLICYSIRATVRMSDCNLAFCFILPRPIFCFLFILFWLLDAMNTSNAHTHRALPSMCVCVYKVFCIVFGFGFGLLHMRRLAHDRIRSSNK